MAAIELQNVTKYFGDVQALDGLDMTVEEGEVFGFLGPNGAGKSTTINILLDFVRPSSGQARVLGHDAQADPLGVKQRTGVLPEGFDVYNRLTGREHVEFAIESKGADEDPDELLERVGLGDDADRKAGGYSKGMAQRLALAVAIAGDPDILILDEPSTGLDPNGAREMREIVLEERDRGATVFFSSHVLGQVEAVCDRVGILRDGDLVAVDSIEGLREKSGAETTLDIEVSDVEESTLETIRGLEGVSDAHTADGALIVKCEGDVKMTVLDALESAGVEVRDFTTRQASLEDLFAAYTEGEQ